MAETRQPSALHRRRAAEPRDLVAKRGQAGGWRAKRAAL
jgi:hypothetical protein